MYQTAKVILTEHPENGIDLQHRMCPTSKTKSSVIARRVITRRSRAASYTMTGIASP